MGKVYAWKLVCGNNILYSYLSSGGTYTTGDCFEIPACSADYARSLQNEEAYAEAFNEMLLHIPTQFLPTLKDYSAYWNIGCDKPKDWKPCDGSGGGSWITCDATANFSETSVVVSPDTTTLQVQYTLTNQDSYTLTSSNHNFVIGSKTTSHAMITFPENLDETHKETTLTLTAKKIGCPDISKTMKITQVGVSCDVSVQWESEIVTVESSQTSVVVGFSVYNEDSYSFTKSGIITNVVDNRNGSVTIYFSESDTETIRTGGVTLKAVKRGCQDVETSITIRQKGISCDVIARFAQSTRTVEATATTFDVGFSVLNQDSYTFGKTGIVSSVTDLGNNTIRVVFPENESQSQKIGTVVLKASKNGCSDVTSTLNILQQGINCNVSASFTSTSKTVSDVDTSFVMGFSVSNQTSYSFTKSGFISNVVDNGNNTITVSFGPNPTTESRFGTVTLTAIKNGCSPVTCTLQITQNGVSCDIQASFSQTGVTVDALATGYTVGFNVVGQDRYDFEATYNISGWTDNGNNTVTILLNPNENPAEKTSVLSLVAWKNECLEPATAEFFITQRAHPCNNEISFNESAATVDYNATGYTVSYSEQNTHSHAFTNDGSVVTGFTDNNGTVTFKLRENPTQGDLVDHITITGKRNNCPDVTDVFTLTQRAQPDPCDFTIEWEEDSVTIEPRTTRVRLNYTVSGTNRVNFSHNSPYVTEIHQYGGGKVDVDVMENDSEEIREIKIYLIGGKTGCPDKSVVCTIYQEWCEPVLSITGLTIQADTTCTVPLSITSYAGCDPRGVTVDFPYMYVDGGVDYSVDMSEYINDMLISYTLREIDNPSFYGYTHSLNLTVNANVLSGIKATSQEQRDILLRSNLKLTVRVTQDGTGITDTAELSWSPTRPEFTSGRKVAIGFYEQQVIGCGVQYFAVCFPKNAAEFVTEMREDMANDPALTRLSEAPTGVARSYESDTEWETPFLTSPDIEWYAYDWALGDETSMSYYYNSRCWPRRDYGYNGVMIMNKTYSREECGYKFVIRSSGQRDCEPGTSYLYVRSTFVGERTDISVTFSQMYAFSNEGIRDLDAFYNEFCPNGFVVQWGNYTYEGETYTHRIRITTERNTYTTDPESLVIALRITQTASGQQEMGRVSIRSCQ